RKRPAGAARSEQPDAVRVDFASRLHIGDGVADVFGMPHRQDETALAFAVAEPAIIEHQNGVARRGEAAMIPFIEFGVVQTEPAGALDNSRPGSGAVIRQSQQSPKLASLTVELHGFLLHLRCSVCQFVYRGGPVVSAK